MTVALYRVCLKGRVEKSVQKVLLVSATFGSRIWINRLQTQLKQKATLTSGAFTAYVDRLSPNKYLIIIIVIHRPSTRAHNFRCYNYCDFNINDWGRTCSNPLKLDNHVPIQRICGFP